jgi:hypothetical protein
MTVLLVKNAWKVGHRPRSFSNNMGSMHLVHKLDSLFINMCHMYTNSHSQKRPGIKVLIRSDHQKHGQGKKRWTDQHLWSQKEPEMTYTLFLLLTVIRALTQLFSWVSINHFVELSPMAIRTTDSSMLKLPPYFLLIHPYLLLHFK